MKLSRLVAALPTGTRIFGDLELEIAGLADHSKRVRPGFLFVSIPGTFDDGHQYIDQAIAAGATAVVSQRDFDHPPEVPRILVDNPRLAISALADRFYDSPGQRLGRIAGVTGTNGKTTVAYLLQQFAVAAGLRPGLIGTAGILVDGRELHTEQHMTTPGAIELQEILGEMAGAGVDLVAMEVSSHALQQHRADHVPFGVAGFTNLTHEHLDYHGDMERYFQAKARLFQLLQPGATAVTNLDDPFGRRMAEVVPAGVGLYTYSLTDQGADLTATRIEMAGTGCRFQLKTPVGTAYVRASGLFGLYNVSNALCAVGMALGMGIPFATLVAALERAHGAPGRFQQIDAGQDFRVIVDYAHTPDGFTKLLESVELIRGDGRIIMVFGSAGGGRDKTKRPIMGRIAAEHAALIVLTEEDSRWEDTLEIMAMIRSGTEGFGRQVEQIEDRVQAIDFAMAAARPGDTVLLLGKGNEADLAVNHPTEYSGDVAAALASIRRRLGR